MGYAKYIMERFSVHVGIHKRTPIFLEISRISSYVAMSQNFHIRNFYVELFSFVSHCIHPIVHEIASGDCYPQPASTADIINLHVVHPGDNNISIKSMNMQHENGTSDCGLFAISVATAICYELDHPQLSTGLKKRCVSIS